MAIELTLLSRVSFRGQAVNGPRLHGLLALLAADLRTGCGTSRLVEGLWPDEQPENPGKALQILVSRIRTRFGADVIEKTAVGYRLTLGEDRIDTSAVLLSLSSAVAQARNGDHASSLAHAEAGLALWDGAEDADPGLGDPLSVLRTERVSTRRALVRVRALALSRLGRAAAAVDALGEVVRERPRDEEALLELLRSEAATAGPSAALARYDAYRRTLRNELGSDPGAALQVGYEQLLKGEMPAVRQGVSHEPNPLVGRDDDIAAVARLLETARVTSIVGPGGLGKTRLANMVSRSARQRVVHFVPLAGVLDDRDVALEVASAIGVGESLRRQGRDGADVLEAASAFGAGEPPRKQAGHSAEMQASAVSRDTDAVVGPATSAIADALGGGPVLLVLDNCEQVVAGVARLVGELVARTRDLRILTTSRTPLGLSSESVYLLPELDLATTVELFTQRATAARPDVDLLAEPVRELCSHLDGLPLAVELAAARVRVMSVADIGRRLGDRFGLLRGGARDAPERHRTLEAVVDWSWNLLEPSGRKAMRTLSVFPGGFAADAARRLLGDDSVLEQLVDQSLLKTVETSSGTRFRMLETVREFSTAQRESSGETDQVLAGFLAWAREFGVANQDAAFADDPIAALELIRAEQDNLLQALRHGLERADGEIIVATSAVLACLWTFEANYSRIASLSGEIAWLLSHYRPKPDFVEPTRIAATLCVANAHAIPSRGTARLLAVLRRLPSVPPDNLIRAVATVFLTPDPTELRNSSERFVAAIANGFVSYAKEQEGDLPGALEAAQRILTGFEQQTNPWIQVSAHGRIGELSLHLERNADAERHIRAALEAMGPWPDVIGFRWGLVTAHLQLGAVDEAEYWIEQAELHRGEGLVGESASRLGIRAEILLLRGEVEAGLRMWRRAVDPALDTEYEAFRSDPPGLEPWTLEAQAAAVVAHAQHGRVDLVEDLVADLPGKITALLTDPDAKWPAYVVVLPICGTILRALALADLAQNASDDEGAAIRASSARMLALAERLGIIRGRGFSPTISSATARETAERADRSAYEEAVAEYADLDHDGLRAAALTIVKDRG